jgi:glycosyltransferase involved in cell wall biosynthesis
MEIPFVSILIPTRNEEKFIGTCLDSLVANDYPKDKCEIIIIDGLSEDDTINQVNDYSNRYNYIKVISNPGRIFPSAVNIGISHSTGDRLFIIGAHAVYPSDYISKCVFIGSKYNADNIGGILNTIPMNNNFSGSLISFVLSNSFGVGNSTFRTGSAEIKEVDTVFGGCYKKEVFVKFGHFNERLISTSDYEFNKRIKRGGAKIILVPDIVVNYYTRSTFKKFINNNLRNGYWAIFPIAVTKNIPVSLRHFIPLGFILSIIGLLILSALNPVFLYILIGILILYLCGAVYFSARSIEGRHRLLPFLPIAFFVLHISYGLGSLWGLLNVGIYRILNQHHVKNPKE